MQMAQTITVKLSITPGGIPPVIHLSQYDKTARTLSFLLVDETGTYTVPSGASATIRGTKPDHTGFMYGCTIYGTTVSVAVQDQMTVCAGRVSCELRIAGSDGSILGTANFWLAIEATALADDVPVSKTDLPLVEKAAENIDTATAAAKTATAKANEATSSATAAANSASAAADSATKSADSATASAASAEAAAASEKNAMSATPDGYSKLAETFNALGLYVDSDGYPCQAINDEAQD